MKNFKRITAGLGVIILLSMYALSLYAGITKKPYSGSLLAASIFLTFAVPVFIYAVLLIYRLVHIKDDLNLKEFKKLNDKTDIDTADDKDNLINKIKNNDKD